MSDACRVDLKPFTRTTLRPLIYGHRGARGPVPENTMAAFQFAADAKADGIELDVRQCKSGEVVVLHDPDLMRVTKGEDARRVADLPWSEARHVRIMGEPLPLLSQVLKFAAERRLRVNVEMKRDLSRRTFQLGLRRQLVAAVADELRRSEAVAMVSSFDPMMLIQFAKLRPEVPRGFLFHHGQARYLPWSWAALAGFEAFHPEHSLVSRKGADFARERGALVNTWTVNDPEEAKRLSHQVDGLITDRADLLRAALVS